MEEFKEFLKSRFTEQQIQILALCLDKNVPVSFYGLGLGKSALAAILRNAGFSNVYAPEDCDVDNAQWSVLDRTGAVALRMKKRTSQYVITERFFFERCNPFCYLGCFSTRRCEKWKSFGDGGRGCFGMKNSFSYAR